MKNIYSNEENFSEIEYLSTLNLIMALFRVTAQDLKYGDKIIKKEATRFLNSLWFREICINMCLEPDDVKRIIIKSKRTGSRTSYE